MATVAKPLTQPGPSYERTRDRFNTAEIASRYSNRFHTRRDQRSRRSILRALASVPAGSSVLDLPCGTGRLTRLLVEQGYNVTCADSSSHMLAQTRKTWQQTCRELRLSEPQFHVQDIMRTTFSDAQFDAIICNRLIHHYADPQTRIAAFRELGRICSGPVIVFFWNSFSLDALRVRLRNSIGSPIRGIFIPISIHEMAANARAAGLRLHRTISTRRLVNKECYAVLLPEKYKPSAGSSH